MKPAHSALDVTATGSAATDKECLVRLRGRCQHRWFLPNMTRRLLKSRAFKDRRALAPFVMSFSIMDASERSQLSRGIVSFSTYDPVYLPVPSFASFLSKHVICPSDNDQRQRVSWIRIKHFFLSIFRTSRMLISGECTEAVASTFSPSVRTLTKKQKMFICANAPIILLVHTVQFTLTHEVCVSLVPVRFLLQFITCCSSLECLT